MMDTDFRTEDMQDEKLEPLSQDDRLGGRLRDPHMATNAAGGLQPVGKPVRILLPGAQTAFWRTQNVESQPQPTGIGQRILAGPQGMTKPRQMPFLGSVQPEERKSWLQQQFPYPKQSVASGSEMLNTRSSPFGFAPQQDRPPYGGFFSSFVPAGAKMNGNESVTGAQSGFGGAKATASGVAAKGNGTQPQVVPVRHIPSRIKQLKPVPEVAPNLSRAHDLPKESKLKLGGLMHGIEEKPIPRAVRHLTRDNINEAAAVAYSENTTGSLAEHEAIISVILNRARSGERQYVDPDKPITVQNVIHGHARLRGGGLGRYQFQGVGGSNEENFAATNDQGSQNDRSAAENIAAHGPTNRATAFIVTDGRAPTPGEVSRLGKVQYLQRVGNVFLYEPKPSSKPAHGNTENHPKHFGARHPHTARKAR
jgi:hypothetical protein